MIYRYIGLALAVLVAAGLIAAGAAAQQRAVAGQMQGMGPIAGAGTPTPMTHALMSRCAIALDDDHIYVVAGNLLLKYDKDLNLINQAQLPVGEVPATPGPMRPMGPGQRPGPGRLGDTTTPRWRAMLAPVEGLEIAARGDVGFFPTRSEVVLQYVLAVENLDTPTAARLELRDGREVAVLFDGPAEPGPFSGVLTSGVITASDLKGPLAGQAVSDLMEAIEGGRVTVVVATRSHPRGALSGVVR